MEISRKCLFHFRFSFFAFFAFFAFFVVFVLFLLFLFYFCFFCFIFIYLPSIFQDINYLSKRF